MVEDRWSGWRRSGRLISLLFVSAASAGCAGFGSGLPRDFVETNALVMLSRGEGSYLAAANQLMARGEPDLALRGYVRAIASDGLSGAVVGGIGAANLQLERDRQALLYLERGTRIAPESASIWNNYGVALAEAGDHRAAREAFAIAESVAPGSEQFAAANMAQLKGRKVASPPVSAFLLVRHASGLYLLMEGALDDEEVRADDSA